MRLSELNELNDEAAKSAFTRCCGSSRWVREMVQARPFASEDELFDFADSAWAKSEREDVLEAFEHHPRIGANLDALREKFAPTKGWSSGEQASVASASEETLLNLQQGNLDYEARYGHIFIVCATGKSAEEMLKLLLGRMSNAPDVELSIAAGEQAKITKIRLTKLLEEASPPEETDRKGNPS